MPLTMLNDNVEDMVLHQCSTEQVAVDDIEAAAGAASVRIYFQTTYRHAQGLLPWITQGASHVNTSNVSCVEFKNGF